MSEKLPPRPEPANFGDMGNPEGWSEDQLHAYALRAIRESGAVRLLREARWSTRSQISEQIDTYLASLEPE